ncbi:hypothetical protein [Thiohalomonas denitrificans]|uniref:DUF4149 domain-containing protein n=1 Tax=Thiohalomonas denitrificans TaxID=415747 RepID=A0A1G5PT78_9GAMM|nr:hypothetical protein [Thiohalomonas denitrificans]SCZ52825.1 hypothetical protein SAMN03097708_00813 [Thiohalomonas denitrificans]
MNRSLLRQEIVPFLLLIGLLLGGTYVADGLLHRFDLVWIGRYLGIPGTLIILLSFLYSMRKRKVIRSGKPGTLLRLHEALTLLGALMILIHAGVHFNAILPWLATAAMLVNIISGLTGRFVLNRSRRHLATKKAAFEQQGMNGEELQQQMFWDAVTVDLMNRWRAIHFPITLVFLVLGLAHILSIFLFWRWQ